MKVKIPVTYDEDLKRCHRFLINPWSGIKGSIYVEKGKEIPDTVIIVLKISGMK